jgi:hypothetical protein
MEWFTRYDSKPTAIWLTTVLIFCDWVRKTYLKDMIKKIIDSSSLRLISPFEPTLVHV